MYGISMSAYMSGHKLELYVGEANCTFKVKTNIMGFRKFTSFLWQQPGNQFKIMKHCLYNNSTCEC